MISSCAGWIKNTRLASKYAGLLFLIFLSGCDGQVHETNGFVEGEFTYFSSPVSGTLRSLLVKRGDSVAKGQILYRLDPEPEQSDVNVAQHQYAESLARLEDIKSPSRATILQGLRAQLNQGKAALVLVGQRLNRTQKLFAKRAIDEDALDAALSEKNQAEARVHSLQAQLAEAELGARPDSIQAAEAIVDANRARLTRAQWLLAQKSAEAPEDARVFDTYYQIGEFVQASKPVLALLIPSDIHIVFYLNSTQISQIHIGSLIQVRCATCKNKIPAAIQYVSPLAEFTPPVIYSTENQNKLVFKILATSKEVQSLLPGQPVTVSLQAAKAS